MQYAYAKNEAKEISDINKKVSKKSNKQLSEKPLLNKIISGNYLFSKFE
jgi:hypothetical protein